ncbi:MAG TPA: sterol desaturase family protein [Allosphingosinicella sp.]|nr:sterol desaturase family protein [Allosphingosinicella sp.]
MLSLPELLDFRLFFLGALLFVPLERLLGARKQQPALRRHWQLDLAYVFANGIVIRIALTVVAVAALAASPMLVSADLRNAVQAQPIWVQFVELLLVSDLIFYLSHRLFHAVPALWRIHQVHHSIEEMDWLAAHRIHPVDQILCKGASILPIFALGFAPAAIGIFALVYHMHTLLLHANLRLGFGPLRWLLTSPDFHHWHHCRDREAWDRNFGTQLAIWDFLFGTAHLPKGRTAQSFGLADPVPATYAGQLLHPFRRPGSEAGRGIG